MSPLSLFIAHVIQASNAKLATAAVFLGAYEGNKLCCNFHVMHRANDDDDSHILSYADADFNLIIGENCKSNESKRQTCFHILLNL